MSFVYFDGGPIIGAMKFIDKIFCQFSRNRSKNPTNVSKTLEATKYYLKLVLKFLRPILQLAHFFPFFIILIAFFPIIIRFRAFTVRATNSYFSVFQKSQFCTYF